MDVIVRNTATNTPAREKIRRTPNPTPPRIGRLSCLLAGLFICLAGCQGSRWARQDPVYEAKYPDHSDNLLQVTKQAVDARYVKGRGGMTSGVGIGPSPATLGGELGAFYYPESWLEGRMALMGLAGTGDANFFGGFSVGARAQVPSRFAPFAGFGLLAGFGQEDATNDGLNNDDDFFIDELGEKEDVAFLALYPEAGLHFWMTPHIRLTTSAGYHITTSGRDYDQWVFSIGLSFLRKYEPASDLNFLAREPAEQPMVFR